MQLFSTILDSLFPARCIGCEGSIESQKEALCDQCRKKIILPQTLFCGVCGARLPLLKKICHQDTPYLSGSIGLYEDPLIRKLVLALKFKKIETTGNFLGNLLANYIKNLNPPLDTSWLSEAIIVPLPLSRERFRERGFNQAASIARGLAKELSLEIAEKDLIRTHHSSPQSQSESVKSRRENVRGVFSVINSNNLKGRKIILVDDVTTTGATLRSAATALKQNGAKEILALTIAR